jgi:Trp operon repressor
VSSTWEEGKRNSSIVEMHETQKWRENLLKSNWPNMKQETALRQLLAHNNETVIGRKIKIVFVLDQQANKQRKLKQF